MNWFKRLTPYITVSLISMIIGAMLVVGCAGNITDKAQKPDSAGSPFKGLQPPTAQAQVSEARNTPIVLSA